MCMHIFLTVLILQLPPSPQINKDGSLIIHDIQHSDRGNYTCAVENTHGKDEISYAVNVRGNKKLKVIKYLLVKNIIIFI